LTISALGKPKERALLSFLLPLAAAVLLFLPFLIYDKGYFIYYGDFNVQQIPFYQMAHDSVRSGNIFWSWTTDLGANFVGSYSFYLLGSPFFWLTLPFPSAAVPYLMGPLLILKFACSSAAAYALLRRFVRPDYALIGGILYAFSGFSIYNVFFNHFHEAIIYFPLMLLGLERFMKDDKRGLFGLMVCLSALNNYYFFIGQAIFIVIYWFVRMFSGEWECTMPKFLWLVFEAVVGTAGAAVLLLPSCLAVIQNPRTESMLAGWDLLIYNKPQRLFDILHSFFFPQDIPARENFFPDSDNKWASMSAWLPVFSCSGAIAYFQSRKHSDWLRRMLIICFFCAVIPGLNAMFQLFNWAYYARWYYMMVLILVLATVKCFEDADRTPVNWNRALGWTFGITAFFALFIGLAPKSWTPDAETGKIQYGLMKIPERFWLFVGIAVICLVVAAVLIAIFKRERENFFPWTVTATLCMSLMVSWYLIGLGKANSNFTSAYVIETAIEGGDKITLPETPNQFTRIDFYNGMDNQGMFWQMPTIQAFHSIVPGSVMEFYPTIGISRGVATRPETKHYAVRSLTSVRWLFDHANTSGRENKSSFFESNGTTQMPGWSYVDTQNDFKIYENEYYIPMGFTYDAMLTRTQYNALSESNRELALLKALVVEDEDAPALSGMLTPLSNAVSYSKEAYYADCLARKAESASSFVRDNRGFTATIQVEKDTPVFFSVPYEDGWTATVDGQAAEIYKVNVGFMAVICPATGGEVTIRFDYHTPGLFYGLLITLGAVLLFLLYYFLMRVWDGRMRRRLEAEIPLVPLDSGDGPDELRTDAPADSPPASGRENTADGFDLYQYYGGGISPPEDRPASDSPESGSTGGETPLPDDADPES